MKMKKLITLGIFLFICSITYSQVLELQDIIIDKYESAEYQNFDTIKTAGENTYFITESDSINGANATLESATNIKLLPGTKLQEGSNVLVRINENALNLPMVFDITGGGAFCSGDNGALVGLSDSEIGISYQLKRGPINEGEPVMGTGESISFGYQVSVGTYTVVATNANGFSTIMNETADVSIISLPNQYEVLGGGFISPTDSGVEIYLNDSDSLHNDSVVDYQLFRNDTLVTTLQGTGNQLSFGTYNNAGEYTVTSINASGCSIQMLGSAKITIVDDPIVFDVTGGGIACREGEGVNIGLSGSELYVNYQLKKGSSDIGLPIAGTDSAIDFGKYISRGDYTVVATNMFNSSVTMNGVANIDDQNNPKVYEVIGNNEFCTGDTGDEIGLYDSRYDTYYFLYRDNIFTGDSIPGNNHRISFGNYNQAGEYTVIAKNQYGCESQMRNSATLTEIPVPAVFNVTGGGPICNGSSGVEIGLDSSQVNVVYTLLNESAQEVASVVGTGDDISFGFFSNVGTYTISAISNGQCQETMNGSVSIFFASNPSDYALNGPDNYCEATTFDLELSGSEINTVYNLILNDTIIDTINGDGSILSFTNLSNAGNYKVKSTTEYGCELISNVLNIAELEIPEIYNLSEGGNFCPGETGIELSLDDSESGKTYDVFRDDAFVESFTGTGSAIIFGTYTSLGVYTVKSASFGTCDEFMNGSAEISNHNSPLQFSVNGGGHYCNGDVGVLVGLDSSQTDVNYQLMLNGTDVLSPITGNNSAIDFGLQTAAGKYMVLATDTNGCQTLMYGSRHVYIDEVPQYVTVAGGGAYCSGGDGLEIHLTSTEDHVYYRLYFEGDQVGTTIAADGDPATFGIFDESGRYHAVADKDNACPTLNMGEVDIVELTLPAKPVIQEGDTVYFNQGTEIILTSSTGYAYLWSTGETTQTISINSEGNYSVKVIDENSCESSISDTTKAIEVLPLQLTKTINESSDKTGNIVITTEGGQEPFIYKWNTGDFTNQLEYIDYGRYSVTVTDLIGNSQTIYADIVNNTPPPPPSSIPGSKGSGDEWNWTLTLTFKEDGTPLTASKSFFDQLGNAHQLQSFHYNDNKKIVSQTIYDDFGRGVITSLPAPVYNTNFEFTSNFFNAIDGSSYSTEHFDEDVNNPQPVSNLNTNTLGWYYSNNNTAEPYAAATDFPYSRVEYSKTHPGVQRQTAGPGESHKMGSGNTSWTFTLPAHASELLNNPLLTTINSNYNPNYEELTKTIVLDADEKESVTYQDAEGNTIATGLIGKTTPYAVEATISAEFGYIDIHLPTVIENHSITVTGDNFKIIDLKTDIESDTTYPEGTLTGIDPGFYRIIAANLNACTIEYDLNYYRFAYNVYDEAGRLVREIQPIGLVNDDVASTYKYNSLGWLLESNNPDLGGDDQEETLDGITKYQYRKDGKIRFSQNPQQAVGVENLESYSYTHYDESGRIVEVGEYRIENSHPTFSEANTILENTHSWADPMEDGLNDDYCHEQSFTFYDEPDPDFSSISGYSTTAYKQEFVLGNVSYTKNDEVITWYSYDFEGKVTWMIQYFKMFDLTKTIDYTYDYFGNVLRVDYQKHNMDDHFAHIYTYDDQLRLVNVKTEHYFASTCDDCIEVDHELYGIVYRKTNLHTRYEYYDHGPVKRVEYGENLQGLDFVYNIHGWLKAVNHPDVNGVTDYSHPLDPGADGFAGKNSEFEADLFGYTLDYYPNDYTRENAYYKTGDLSEYQYNGNIASMRWKSSQIPLGQGEVWNYQYTYDNRNWLTSAVFGISTETYTNNMRYNANSTNPYANFTPDTNNAYKVDSLTYDLNGNIKSLSRNAYLIDVTGTTATMDNLLYDYKANTNKLIGLKDHANPDDDFGDITKNSTGYSYAYDYLGRMTENGHDGFTFDYNVVDKVKEVRNSSDASLVAKYHYDDKGFRFYKELNDNKGTFYVRDASGNILATYNTINNGDGTFDISNAEAFIYSGNRIGKINLNAGWENAKSIYELSDHLGNVRVSFSKDGDDVGDELDVLSYVDYYPFGMEMPGRNNLADAYGFGYQGQFAEKDEETGYSQFEARLWDNRLGRWMSPDPAKQSYSPYWGMSNNPMLYIDPNGEYPIIANLDGEYLYFSSTRLSDLFHTGCGFAPGFSILEPLIQKHIGGMETITQDDIASVIDKYTTKSSDAIQFGKYLDDFKSIKKIGKWGGWVNTILNISDLAIFFADDSYIYDQILQDLASYEMSSASKEMIIEKYAFGFAFLHNLHNEGHLNFEQGFFGDVKNISISDKNKKILIDGLNDINNLTND